MRSLLRLNRVLTNLVTSLAHHLKKSQIASRRASKAMEQNSVDDVGATLAAVVEEVESLNAERDLLLREVKLLKQLRDKIVADAKVVAQIKQELQETKTGLQEAKTELYETKTAKTEMERQLRAELSELKVENDRQQHLLANNIHNPPPQNETPSELEDRKPT